MAGIVQPRVLTRAAHQIPRCKAFRVSEARFLRRGTATFTSSHQASQISILQTTVDKNSNAYKENAASMADLMAKLTQLHGTAARGGPEKARQKHLERGKMLVRDRVTALIDPGSSFLELSALAGHDMYPGDDVPAGGIVTGIGTVEGVMCMIVANDSTYVFTKLADAICY